MSQESEQPAKRSDESPRAAPPRPMSTSQESEQPAKRVLDALKALLRHLNNPDQDLDQTVAQLIQKALAEIRQISTAAPLAYAVDSPPGVTANDFERHPGAREFLNFGLGTANDPDARSKVLNRVCARLDAYDHDSAWIDTCVTLAAELVIDDEQQRDEVANSLLQTAKREQIRNGPSPTVWSAIRRFGSLVPAHRLSELAWFLRPGTHAETMQACLQTLWYSLSVAPNPGLPELAERTEELLGKYLDRDWLCTALNQSLTVSALLAGALLSSTVEPLEPLFRRVHELDDLLFTDLAAVDVHEAIAYAREHELPTLARLEQLGALLNDSDADF